MTFWVLFIMSFHSSKHNKVSFRSLRNSFNTVITFFNWVLAQCCSCFTLLMFHVFFTFFLLLKVSFNIIDIRRLEIFFIKFVTLTEIKTISFSFWYKLRVMLKLDKRADTEYDFRFWCYFSVTLFLFNCYGS